VGNYNAHHYRHQDTDYKESAENNQCAPFEPLLLILENNICPRQKADKNNDEPNEQS